VKLLKESIDADNEQFRRLKVGDIVLVKNPIVKLPAKYIILMVMPIWK
jgi:hypothetical protein